MQTNKQFQDIAIFDLRRESPPADDSNKPCLCMRIAAVILVTLIFVALGYFVGWRAGFLTPPQTCCTEELKLDFEFQLFSTMR